jgi:hypothetical protein
MQILKGDGLVSKPACDAFEAQLLRGDWPWDDIFEPGPSIFGWSYDPSVIACGGLDDYQRIVPTIAVRT